MLRGDRQGRDLRHEVEVSSEISLTLRHQQPTVLGDLVFEDTDIALRPTTLYKRLGRLLRRRDRDEMVASFRSMKLRHQLMKIAVYNDRD